MESILVSGNQANAFESASSATGYHLDYSKFFLSSKITIFSCSDLTPLCLIPTQVLFFPRDFPATVSHSRRCQRLTSISGNPDNGHHATLHTCSSAPGMSIRGSHRTKGCFSGCTRTPQCRPVMSHSSVWRRCPLGWAAWGEFGLRTSCVPSGQRTPLVSHGVTVGHHRPTP